MPSNAVSLVSPPTDTGKPLPPTHASTQVPIFDLASHTGILFQDFEENFTKGNPSNAKALVLGSTLEKHPNGRLGTEGFWGAETGTVYNENATLVVVEDMSWLSPHAIYALMVTSGCLGILVFCTNVCLLVASKFASGGRTPMLIFLRSLCVADALIGIFAVFKMTQFIPAMRWEWVNCFLPESVLFTAIIASNLTHVMLSTMCFSMLKDMLRFDRKQDKHRSIFSMTFLWNGSFVVGFVPHMGWNLDDHMGWNSINRKCLFLRYVPQSYLGVVTAIMSLSIVWLLVVHIALQVLSCRNKFQEPSLLELTSPVICTTRVDVVLQLACYLPGALYIFLTCDSCAYIAEWEDANNNLSALIPLMIARATGSTALHFKRTDQMRDIIYYCIKVVKHRVLVKTGSSTTIRPVRPSLRRPSTRAPSIEAENCPKFLPSPKGLASPHPQTVPIRENVRTPSHLVFSASQPTIAEETLEVETTSPVEDLSPAMSSAPSWSTSDVTLASTLGSNSGGSSNGISPFTRQKSLNNKSAVNQNGLKPATKSPVELKNLPSSGLMGPSSRYWVGEIPKRESVTSPQPSQSATYKMMKSPEDTPSVPASPHRRLLWVKSPLTSQFTGGPLSPAPQERPSQIQNDNMDILSARRLDTDYGNWKPPKGNVLESEVIVHAQEENRLN